MSALFEDIVTVGLEDNAENVDDNHYRIIFNNTETNQIGKVYLSDMFPSHSFTTGFLLKTVDYTAVPVSTVPSIFSVMFQDDVTTFKFVFTSSSSGTALSITMENYQTDHFEIYPIYSGNHPSLYNVDFIPLDIKLLNGFLTLTVNNSIWINKLDMDQHPLSLESGYVKYEASCTTEIVSWEIKNIYFEPIVVFNDDVYFERSIFAEQYEGQFGDSVPVGTITAFYGTVINDVSWLLCDGATYNRADYPQLASFLGIPFNQATFQVPDLRGKFLKSSADTTTNLKTNQGSDTVTLTVDNLPSHTHTGTVSGTTNGDGSHSHTIDYRYSDGTSLWHKADNNYVASASSGGQLGTGTNQSAINGVGNHTHTFSAGFVTNTTGSGTPITINPSHKVINYIIKARSKNESYSEYRVSDYWAKYTQTSLYYDGTVGIGGMNTTNNQLLVNGNSKLNGNLEVSGNLTTRGDFVINGNVGVGTQNPIINFKTLFATEPFVKTKTPTGNYPQETYPIYPETPVIGSENIYTWEGVSGAYIDTLREPLIWNGRLKYAVGTTDYSIGDTGLTVGGVNYVGSGNFTTLWNQRYLIAVNQLRVDPAIPEQVTIWSNGLPTNTNRFVINMPVKTGVSHMFFLQVISGDRWSSVSVYIRNKNNTTQVFRCPAMTNSQQGAAEGASCMVGPDGGYGASFQYHEWLMFPIPQWVIDTYSSENNLDPLYYAYPKSIRIEVIAGENNTNGGTLYITGIAMRTNPFNLSITTALPLYWNLNGGEAATWNSANWNEENLMQINNLDYLYCHVPICTNEKISDLTSISQISDILMHYTLVLITHRSYTPYDTSIRVSIGYRSGGVIGQAMELGRPSHMTVGRYGKYFSGGHFRHPMGIVLPKLAKASALSTQLAFIDGQPYLKVLIRSLGGRNTYLRGIYLEKTSDVYLRTYADKWRGDYDETRTKDLYLGGLDQPPSTLP